MLSELENIKEKVDKLYEYVFEGNGKSLSTQMALTSEWIKAQTKKEDEKSKFNGQLIFNLIVLIANGLMAIALFKMGIKS